MRVTLLGGANLFKQFSVNWDNRTATPIGGGSGQSCATVFAGCSLIALAVGTSVYLLSGTFEDIAAGIDTIHAGSRVAA